MKKAELLVQFRAHRPGGQGNVACGATAGTKAESLVAPNSG
jgi:hypothetical protein